MSEHDETHAHDDMTEHDILDIPDSAAQQHDATQHEAAAHENDDSSHTDANIPTGEVLSVAGVVTNAQLN